MYIRIRCIAKVLIKRILLLAFASFLTLSFKNANSQEVNVSGTVMCAETGRLLKDVKIIVPQKKIIALTDIVITSYSIHYTKLYEHNFV